VISAVGGKYVHVDSIMSIPVVSVYETMPAGYDYQSWMMAEASALTRAVGGGTSTRQL
jgi:zinc/manganese transport system substrate-binding protein